jgi:DEAD/DEAH box helicase domain-containing protein
VEHAVVDPSNVRLLQSHLVCAAFEHPLLLPTHHATHHATHQEDPLSDGALFGGELAAATAAAAVREGLLGPDASQPATAALHYIGGARGGPAEAISLRAVSDGVVRVVDDATGEVLEEIEDTMAFFQVSFS